VIVIQTLISHPEAERVLDAAKQGRVWGHGCPAGIERFVKVAKAK
jgi:hypothetical protein